MSRYENLEIGEALSKNHLYPSACNELSSILNLAYSGLPKDIKASIFQDTLSAFRLLPSMNTSAAVSASNLLLKSVEAVFPKQKKNLSFVEFKKAKVALKRRSKSQKEDTDLPSLPQDILIDIFSFLDVSSLLSSSQVSRSWNQATHDESLWRSQFEIYFKHRDLVGQSGMKWREAFKLIYIASNSSKVIKSGRGYCCYCRSIVWHDKVRCPNKKCRIESGNEPLDLITSNHVVNYFLGVESLADESGSDDEDGLWAYISDSSWIDG